MGSASRSAYFDQLRAQLDEGRTLRENVAEGDTVMVDGKPRPHHRLSSGFPLYP